MYLPPVIMHLHFKVFIVNVCVLGYIVCMVYEECSLILVTCLIIFSADNQWGCCSYVVKARSFLIRLVSKLLLSDARSYSNRILKQGTVMTLR